MRGNPGNRCSRKRNWRDRKVCVRSFLDTESRTTLFQTLSNLVTHTELLMFSAYFRSDEGSDRVTDDWEREHSVEVQTCSPSRRRRRSQPTVELRTHAASLQPCVVPSGYYGLSSPKHLRHATTAELPTALSLSVADNHQQQPTKLAQYRD